MPSEEYKFPEWTSEIHNELKNSPLTRSEAFEEAAKEKLCLQKELHRYLKKAQNKQAMLQHKLAECYGWQQVHHEGLLLQSHLYKWKQGFRALKVVDWEQQNQEREIALSPPLSGQEEVALRFRKSKKLRLGIPHIEREVEKNTSLIKRLQILLQILESMDEIDTLHALRQLLFPLKPKLPATEVKRKLALPYREFWSTSGHPIWVGKKAKDNETLSFRLAHGSDWWLHVQGFPGSHVILKGFKQREPDEDSLQDALQLALYYSQARKQGHADVVVTQQKYLSRFGKGKKKEGKVQISKFKILPVEINPESIEEIKKRSRLTSQSY